MKPERYDNKMQTAKDFKIYWHDLRAFYGLLHTLRLNLCPEFRIISWNMQTLNFNFYVDSLNMILICFMIPKTI